MIGIQFRRIWEDRDVGRGEEKEERIGDRDRRKESEWNFQLGVLITGCVVVERERQRIKKRGTIGMGLILGMVSV